MGETYFFAQQRLTSPQGPARSAAIPLRGRRKAAGGKMGVIFFLHSKKISLIFAPASVRNFIGRYMVNVVQLVRTSDCGSESRGFESHLSPVLIP